MLLLPFLAMIIPAILVGMLMAGIGYIIFAVFSFFIVDRLSDKEINIYLLFSPVIASVFQIFSLINPLLWLGKESISINSAIEFMELLFIATIFFGYLFLFVAMAIYKLLSWQGVFSSRKV